ncbi:putative transposable element [Trichonephila clavipes]|nr:putative transposable element [Trichonephila clavipes]
MFARHRRETVFGGVGENVTTTFKPCSLFDDWWQPGAPPRSLGKRGSRSLALLPWIATGKDVYTWNKLVALHLKHDQARRRFVEWAQNEIAVVPDFHKRLLFSDEAHFWLNGYVNKQNCRIWSEANPLAYVETPLHPEKLTVWCALWAGGILLQKR